MSCHEGRGPVGGLALWSEGQGGSSCLGALADVAMRPACEFSREERNIHFGEVWCYFFFFKHVVN